MDSGGGILMILRQMTCCGFNEISGLSSHRSAKDAMRAFCETFTRFGSRRIGAFYIFTAVVKSTTDNAAGEYGDNFAKFIKNNKLGEVTATVVRVNRRNVPGHFLQGWIWSPSEANLKAWWAKNGGRSGN